MQSNGRQHQHEQPSNAERIARTADAAADVETTFDIIDDEDGPDDVNANDDNGIFIFTRDKSDYWHGLYNTKLPTDCPAEPFIFKLLHQATRAINE